MSQTKLRSAKFSINELVKKSSVHAYASKADMRHMLFRCIKDLHELGFKVANVKGLQAKHIYALVDHWKSQGKNTATIKNYMSKLRHTASLLSNPKLVKPDNATYNVDKRSYKPTINKAIHNLDLSKCTDPYIKLSLEGQALFGLRREESMKFTLGEALHGNELKIMPSWTKGGIGRMLQVTSDAQSQWLDKVARLVPTGASLIPQERSYKQHLSHYEAQAKLMGVSKLHGLRHAYAQRRYKELTKGLPCPFEGGKAYNKMNAFEKTIDRKARQIISRELGHSRIQITKIYLG
ncbi:MAG: integrase domain-containing protein [Legionellaceae bacterium]|nr:integrase domain-containing protein [Legionellaceae bacterium]